MSIHLRLEKDYLRNIQIFPEKWSELLIYCSVTNNIIKGNVQKVGHPDDYSKTSYYRKKIEFFPNF